MKILISACATDNGKSGIGQYTRAIIEQFVRQPGDSLQLTIYTDHEASFLEDLTVRPEVNVVALPRMFKSVIGSLVWHFFVLPILTLLRNPDLVLFLAANRRLSWIPWVPTIAVVHDLSQLHIKGKYDAFRTFYVLRILTFLMRRASRVVSVSHSTRRDLVSYARVRKARVSVVHNGAELARFTQAGSPEVLDKYGIDRPYLIYTARLEHPGKNHVNLIRAFSKMRNHREMQLVLAGSPWNGAEAIYDEVTRLELEEHVVFTGFVPDADLPMLVQTAEVFVFPSLFEGFGIPLLEAMASSTAVCASNRSSLPEVAGSAALLFDPEDSDDMARVVQEALLIPELRAELVYRGRKRADRFTWQKSAAELLNECRRTVLLSNPQEMTRQITT